MISERELSEVHSSVWAELAPNLPRIVRGLNLSGRESFAPPMIKRVAPERVYMINEVAFQLFLAAEMGYQPDLDEMFSRIPSADRKTDRLIVRSVRLSDFERQDATELAHRTRASIPPYVRNSIIKIIESSTPERADGRLIIPQFKGVGILSPCTGDGQFGNTLLEIKSGGRDIRSIDLRQVIVYYILGVLEQKSPPIDYCLLVNPRQGYRMHFHFQGFMSAVSGLPTSEFTAIFRDYLVNWKVSD